MMKGASLPLRPSLGRWGLVGLEGHTAQLASSRLLGDDCPELTCCLLSSSGVTCADRSDATACKTKGTCNALTGTLHVSAM